MTALAGSRTGTCGMSTSPAPSWPRRDARLLPPVRAEPDPLQAVPALASVTPGGVFSPHSSQ
jgi:hypothetical protein